MPNYISKITPLNSDTIYDIRAYKTASIPMGTVDSTSTSTAFTATVDGITELRNGVTMWLRNGAVTSAEGYTININGLGAKPVYMSTGASSRSTTQFNKNYACLFVYNGERVTGGCWDFVVGYDSNTTYTNMTQAEADAGTATNARSISAAVLSTSIINKLYGLAPAIVPPSDTTYDLDDYVTPGRYRVPSSTEAANILNAPITTAGYELIVKYTSQSSYITQMVYPALNASGASRFYMRHYRGSGSGAVHGWSPWYVYEGTVMT